MTRIDFYVLQAQSAQERLQFAARLIEKAWLQQCQVVVMAEEASASALDHLLWHFKPESFVPHGRNPTTADPVAIRLPGEEPPHRDLVVNLTNRAIPDFEQFQRLAEIVVQTPDVLEATRQQYGLYRQRGFIVNTHKLT